MTRPLLLTAGSRGDIEPMLSLAEALSNSTNHTHPHVLLQSDHTPPSTSTITYHPLPFSKADFAPPFARAFQAASPHTSMSETLLRASGLLMADVIIPALDTVLAIAKTAGSNVIITTYVTLPLAHTLAHILNLNVLLILLQPIGTTSYYPHLMLSDHLDAAVAMHSLSDEASEAVQSTEHRNSYLAVQRIVFTGMETALNDARARYKLPNITLEDYQALHTGDDTTVTIVNAMPTALVSRAPDAASRTRHTNPLADTYIPCNWQPNETQTALEAFLAADDERPIAVSYGSMDVSPCASGVTRAVLTGLRDAGVRRVVLLPGTAGLSVQLLKDTSDGMDASLIAWAKEHVFETVGNVQYAWLLPQCEALLCHGGAGAIMAAMAAGIPAVVTPVMFDQNFWGAVLERKGLGAVAGMGLRQVSAGEIASGVKKVRDEDLIERVREYAKVRRASRDGVEEVGSMLEGLVNC